MTEPVYPQAKVVQPKIPLINCICGSDGFTHIFARFTEMY